MFSKIWFSECIGFVLFFVFFFFFLLQSVCSETGSWPNQAHFTERGNGDQKFTTQLKGHLVIQITLLSLYSINIEVHVWVWHSGFRSPSWYKRSGIQIAVETKLCCWDIQLMKWLPRILWTQHLWPINTLSTHLLIKASRRQWWVAKMWVKS